MPARQPRFLHGPEKTSTLHCPASHCVSSLPRPNPQEEPTVAAPDPPFSFPGVSLPCSGAGVQTKSVLRDSLNSDVFYKDGAVRSDPALDAVWISTRAPAGGEGLRHPGCFRERERPWAQPHMGFPLSRTPTPLSLNGLSAVLGLWTSRLWGCIFISFQTQGAKRICILLCWGCWASKDVPVPNSPEPRGV